MRMNMTGTTNIFQCSYFTYCSLNVTQNLHFVFLVCSEYFNKCYILLNGHDDFFKNEPVGLNTWTNVKIGVCEHNGWSLTNIHSKLENDFIGNHLLQQFYNLKDLHAYIGKSCSKCSLKFCIVYCCY